MSALAGKRRAWATSVVVMAALLMIAGAAARGGQAPVETAAYKRSDLPGYRLVLANCLTCHSAEYVLTQPPTSPRTYWDATVKKMKKPFGAPFPDDDAAAMVDYLAKTYGAERPGVVVRGK